MARPTPLSGFPEWLPSGRIVEQHILDALRRTFELHGFAGIETRAVEPLDQLLRKGETSKEVYVLRRLQEEAPATADASDSSLGLHFDLTVPFARYVLENAGHLAFPFKRYQIQKVWRGERPQEGRFREFVQADIDVVAAARRRSQPVRYGDVGRAATLDALKLETAKAVVLTMDDPVQNVRLTRRLRGDLPELTIVSRARDTDHAGELYRAGASDAVPDTLESSLQLSEAVLVDLGVAMGPVIASIHAKRDELRTAIKDLAGLENLPGPRPSTTRRSRPETR